MYHQLLCRYNGLARGVQLVKSNCYGERLANYEGLFQIS